MLVVVNLRLSWNPHLGLDVAQHVLWLLLQVAVTSVIRCIRHCSRNLQGKFCATLNLLASDTFGWHL